MLNRVVLVGRLTRDPEVKYTVQGVAVARFGLAVNRVTKNDQGDYEVDFFDIVAFRRTADFVGQYLKKGRLVSVDGRLQTRSWTDQQTGQKRTGFEIIADNVNGLDRRDDAEGAPQGEGSYAAPAPATASRPAASLASGAARSNAPAADDAIDESDPFADE